MFSYLLNRIKLIFSLIFKLLLLQDFLNITYKNYISHDAGNAYKFLNNLFFDCLKEKKNHILYYCMKIYFISSNIIYAFSIIKSIILHI